MQEHAMIILIEKKLSKKKYFEKGRENYTKFMHFSKKGY